MFPVQAESLRGYSRDESIKAGVSSFGYAERLPMCWHAAVGRDGKRNTHIANQHSSGAPTNPTPVLFLFTGQGSQYEGMGGALRD